MTPSSCCIIFYFQCFPARRSLHSFPTRRSSDLEINAEFIKACGAPQLKLRYCQDGKKLPLKEKYSAEEKEMREDRKSTRLNSSHPSISYAVFCLKKKTVICLKKKHKIIKW